MKIIIESSKPTHTEAAILKQKKIEKNGLICLPLPQTYCIIMQSTWTTVAAHTCVLGKLGERVASKDTLYTGELIDRLDHLIACSSI